jgi:hypothetical protein
MVLIFFSGESKQTARPYINREYPMESTMNRDDQQLFKSSPIRQSGCGWKPKQNNERKLVFDDEEWDRDPNIELIEAVTVLKKEKKISLDQYRKKSRETTKQQPRVQSIITTIRDDEIANNKRSSCTQSRLHHLLYQHLVQKCQHQGLKQDVQL